MEENKIKQSRLTPTTRVMAAATTVLTRLGRLVSPSWSGATKLTLLTIMLRYIGRLCSSRYQPDPINHVCSLTGRRRDSRTPKTWAVRALATLWAKEQGNSESILWTYSIMHVHHVHAKCTLCTALRTIIHCTATHLTWSTNRSLQLSVAWCRCSSHRFYIMGQRRFLLTAKLWPSHESALARCKSLRQLCAAVINSTTFGVGITGRGKVGRASTHWVFVKKWYIPWYIPNIQWYGIYNGSQPLPAIVLFAWFWRGVSRRAWLLPSSVLQTW